MYAALWQSCLSNSWDSDCFGCLIPRASLALPSPPPTPPPHHHHHPPLGENIDRCMMIESDENNTHEVFKKSTRIVIKLWKINNKKYLQHASLMKNATECWRKVSVSQTKPKNHSHRTSTFTITHYYCIASSEKCPKLRGFWAHLHNTFTGITIICHQNMMVSVLPINNWTMKTLSPFLRNTTYIYLLINAPWVL